MRVKTLVIFRSKPSHPQEIAATASQILHPQMIWEPLMIQALVDRGLLRSKAEVERKAPTDKAFPTEDDKERVVFLLRTWFQCAHRRLL
jgi:hypothetical protein